jgi:hypothetical protein
MRGRPVAVSARPPSSPLDRAWLFGIAAHVFARHCEQSAGGRDAVARLGGHRTLDEDEIEELTPKEAVLALGVRYGSDRVGMAGYRRCEASPPPARSARNAPTSR